MKGINKIISLLTITILIFSLTGCNNKGNTSDKPVAKGFLWEATKEDTTINLVGTMHPAPTTHNLISDKMLDAIYNSDDLWVEVDLNNKDNLKKLEKSYYLESGESIEDYLSQDEIKELSTILKKYNVKLEDVKNYNAYALGSVIESLIMQDAGFTGPVVDSLIITLANKKDVEIKEVEGIDYQTNLLKKIYTWDTVKESIKVFDEEKQKVIDATNILFENYVEGNIEAANQYEIENKGDYDSEVYKALMVDRNIEMVEKINKYMKDGKKHTLAVGYRHFMGEDSIIKLLENDGYDIKEIN